MNPKNKIDAYELGKTAFAEFNALPSYRFPLEENKEHNAPRWNSHLPVNPFPKNSTGGAHELEGFYEEWRRGWFEALHASVYGTEETEGIQP